MIVGLTFIVHLFSTVIVNATVWNDIGLLHVISCIFVLVQIYTNQIYFIQAAQKYMFKHNLF